MAASTRRRGAFGRRVHIKFDGPRADPCAMGEGTTGWPASDAQLLDGILDGDELRFADLFRRYAEDVYRYCGRRTGNWDQSEDLMSIVLLEAWRSRRRAHLVEASLRPWLLAIAINVLRNAGRSHRRHSAALERYRARLGSEVENLEEETITRLDAQRQSFVVTSAMKQLRPSVRDAIELCVFEGISPAAAARILGITESTVRSRVHRGRSVLRRLLQSGEKPHGPCLSGHRLSERPAGASVNLRKLREHDT